MKLRCEIFPGVLHTKKPKGLKRLECWNGFIVGNPHTHLLIGGVTQNQYFYKVVEKYIGDKSISTLEKLCDD